MKQKEIENLSNSDTLTSIQLAVCQLGFLNHWKMYFPVSSYGDFSCNFWWTKTLSVPDISPLCQNCDSRCHDINGNKQRAGNYSSGKLWLLKIEVYE